ncbi:hypothetical protein Fmac_021427 [Flemingia macrophylla]|uniref:Uncharacterized protein n=1 Tax=Flemingia macrophylla TaxID=520843 RepID=A0ABD1LWW1_9FABA
MSSIAKAPPSSDDTEESGWTTYFDDFFNNHVHNNKCSSMSLSGGVASSNSSHVSDAASLVEKKVMSNSKHVEEEFCVNKNVKRTSFKKKNNKDIITAFKNDDALEDTATSPLNNPNKVLCANQKIHKANRQK